MYYAIIGDIIDSRKASDRNALQKNLKKVISNLNESLSELLASPLVLTEGDSFQGLFQYSFPLVYTISRFQNELYPYKVRFGIGVGELSTQLNPQNSLENDGPAYYLARNAIEYIKNQKYTGFAVCIRTGQIKLDCILNSFCREMNVHAKSWSSTQEKCVHASQVRPTKTLSAQLAGVELSSYSRILSRAHLSEYELSLSEFERYLFYEFDLNRADEKNAVYYQYIDFLFDCYRFEDSLAISQELSATFGSNPSVMCLSYLAQSYFYLNQPEKALRICQNILHLMEDPANESLKHFYHTTLANLSACLVRLHQHSSAEKFLKQLLSTPDISKDTTLYLVILQNLKNSYLAQDKIHEALDLCDKILDICQDSNNDITPSRRSAILVDALWNKVRYSSQPFQLEDILKYFNNSNQTLDSIVLHRIMQIVVIWGQQSAAEHPIQSAQAFYLAWYTFIHIEQYEDAIDAGENFLTLYKNHSDTFNNSMDFSTAYNDISKWYTTFTKKKKGYSKKKKE